MVGIWGANFSVIKYALRDFPEVSFNAMRLCSRARCFWSPFCARGPAEPALTRRDWATLVGLALVGTVLYQLFFLAGIARTSVANSALIFGCTPVAVAIMSSIAGHERLTLARWAGAALSLAGIYALVGHRAELSAATLMGDAARLLRDAVLVALLGGGTTAAQAALAARGHRVGDGDWCRLIWAVAFRRSSEPIGEGSRLSVGS